MLLLAVVAVVAPAAAAEQLAAAVAGVVALDVALDHAVAAGKAAVSNRTQRPYLVSTLNWRSNCLLSC